MFRRLVFFQLALVAFLFLVPLVRDGGKIYSQSDADEIVPQNIIDNHGEFWCDVTCLFGSCKCSDIDKDVEDTGGQGQSGDPTPTIDPDLPDPGELKDRIKREFNITMIGFSQLHLNLAYNKFSQVSKTKFFDLVGDTVIVGLAANRGSRQTSCRRVELGQYNDEEHFQVVLFHELGHIIRNCAKRGDQSHLSQHARIYDSKRGEGPLTEYSRTVCGRTSTIGHKLSEDYAETVTYYLNPGADEHTAPCAGRRANPYLNGRRPQHFNFVRELLGVFP